MFQTGCDRCGQVVSGRSGEQHQVKESQAEKCGLKSNQKEVIISAGTRKGRRQAKFGKDYLEISAVT